MARIDHRKRDRRRSVFAFAVLSTTAISGLFVVDAFQLDVWSSRTTAFITTSDHCSMYKLFAVNPNNKASSTKRVPAASGTRRKNGTQKRASDQVQENKTTNRIRITKQPRHGWGYRVQQLQSFCNAKGHCWVTARHEEEYPGLYQWTRTVRSKYRHQVRVVQDDDNNTKNVQQFLSPGKLQQLVQLGFVWEPQEDAWQSRLSELQRFYATHGHCRVPNNSLDYPGLGVWVRNQRREYDKLIKIQQETNTTDDNAMLSRGNTSGTRCSLTPARLRALEELDFDWYRSHTDAWQTRYEQLVEYYGQNGHSNVPQPQTQHCGAPTERNKDVDEDQQQQKNGAVISEQQQHQLGNWCMNQRTAYRKYLAGQPTALTPERIEKLEAINFQWNVHRYKWKFMLQRLQNYQKVHGHINIAVNDAINDDLRLWLIWQRFLYNCRQVEAAAAAAGNSSARRPSPLTDDRIKALENAIPKFQWKVRAGNSGGPSSKDWALLFNALRDKGFQPGMRPKQHWFEGTNPFSMAVKSTYTEEDLLELWHQEADDEEEDLDDGGGVPLETDPWYDN